MDEGNQQSTNPQQSLTDPRLAHQKVLQPDASFVAEMKSSQQPIVSPNPTQPVVTAELQTPALAPTSANEAKTTGTSESQFPVVMSASQMGIDQSQHERNWKSVFKPVLAAVV